VAKLTKSTPWWNLAVGLLALFTFVRDQWIPGFLSITGRRHHSGAWMNLVVAALFLFAACRDLMRMRTPSAQ
jgi:hypothetical protein